MKNIANIIFKSFFNTATPNPDKGNGWGRYFANIKYTINHHSA